MKQREIKFRAWDGKKMHDWGFLKDGWYGPPSTNGKNYKEMPQMQYTGLHDKNGKEIYEGDILVNKHAGEMEVFWDADCWSLGGVGGRFGLNIMAETCEIIGNICENPDLLTNKQ